jgi:hypothetical protein
VPVADAKKAKRLVTTIWNKHQMRVEGSSTRKTIKSAILQDREGRYWYEVLQPGPTDVRITWRAHCKKLDLAFEWSIPILGILKDYKTGLCASQHLFDCVGRRFYKDGKGFYLELQPQSEIGCDVKKMEIENRTRETAFDDELQDGLRPEHVNGCEAHLFKNLTSKWV